MQPRSITDAARGAKEVDTRTIEKHDEHGRLLEQRIVGTRNLPGGQLPPGSSSGECRTSTAAATPSAAMEVTAQREKTFAEPSEALSPEAYAGLQRLMS